MGKNINSKADFTVGDTNVPIDYTTDEDMTGDNIDFIFIKPSGESIIRDASSISTYTARYIWASGDLDEDGVWQYCLRNVTNVFEYQGTGSFTVRPKAEEMAVSR
jgi:hypothetical protein